MVKKINIEDEVIETVTENKSGFRTMTLEQVIDSICEQLKDSENDNDDIAISIYFIQPGKSKKRIFLYGQSQFVINATQYCENNANIMDILIENLQNFTGKEIEIEAHIKCAALDIKTSKREIICIPELKAEPKTDTVMFEKIISERERKIEELESELKQKSELLQKKEIELTIERKNTEMLILKQSNQMPAGVTLRDIMEMQGRNRGGDNNGQLNFVKSQYEMQINNLNTDKRELRDKINELEKKLEELRNENIDLKLELNAMEYSTEGNSVMDSVDRILDRVSPILPMLLGLKNNLPLPAASKKETPANQPAEISKSENDSDKEALNEKAVNEILYGEYRSYVEMTLHSLKELFDKGLATAEIQRSFIEPYKDIYSANIRPYLQYRALIIPKISEFAANECGYSAENIARLKEFIETLN